MAASSSLLARLRIASASLRLGRGATQSYSTSSSSTAAPSSQATFTRQFVFRLLGLATWLPVAIWFNSTVVEVTRIEGPSMYPFLNSRFNETLERDWVVNRKLYAQEGLQRGMVVFLKYVSPRCVTLCISCILTDQEPCSPRGCVGQAHHCPGGRCRADTKAISNTIRPHPRWPHVGRRRRRCRQEPGQQYIRASVHWSHHRPADAYSAAVQQGRPRAMVGVSSRAPDFGNDALEEAVHCILYPVYCVS